MMEVRRHSVLGTTCRPGIWRLRSRTFSQANCKSLMIALLTRRPMRALEVASCMQFARTMRLKIPLFSAFYPSDWTNRLRERARRIVELQIHWELPREHDLKTQAGARLKP